LDETIIFDRLAREDMGGIVDIQVSILAARLEARGLEFSIDEDARNWLANEGYDPVFGARPLKRVIQRALQNPLAELLLAGEIMHGSGISVSADENGLVIDRQAGAAL
jgi:ATP-dependent Clp protease ATP-binding subunit ClpB